MTTSKLNLDVLRVQQPIGEFFLASISARDLVSISFSDVRRLASNERDIEKYLGIQRPVSSRRIKQIKKYIEGSDAGRLHVKSCGKQHFEQVFVVEGC